MESFLTLDSLFTLVMLIFLQAVLGFDNLLYISIESKRAPIDKQSFVRQLGVGLAIGLRIALLFLIVAAIDYFQEPFLSIKDNAILTTQMNVHSVIVLAGGVFIIYTAVKEIYHMLSVDDIEGPTQGPTRTVMEAVTWIVLMNLVFSFDSILSAIALTDNFWIMAIAIVISGVLMIWLSDHVAEFLKRNRMYEVLGLFILFIVGIMLLSEGGHLAHLEVAGFPIEPMAKSTFYFAILVLVAVEVVQGGYQRKLESQRQADVSKQVT